VTEGEGKKGGQPKLPRVKDLSGKHESIVLQYQQVITSYIG
jgi:hypothetical protein